MCTAMIIRMLYILHFQQVASAADIADFDDEKYGFEYIYHDETVSMLMLLLRTRVEVLDDVVHCFFKNSCLLFANCDET